MAELVKADGESAEVVKAIMDNPYAIGPAALANLAHRAKAVQEINSLKAEIERLKANTNTIVKTIDEAAKKPSALTGASGASPSSGLGPLTEEEINKLTPAQVKEYLAKARKEEG